MIVDPVIESLGSVIADRINVGVFVIDRDKRVVLWNRFMATHSGKRAEDVIGRDLITLFPEVNGRWLKKKLDSVFMLGNYAFTSWQHRPYLFEFPHHRPVTGGVDFMQQDCTFLPVKNAVGVVEYVCVTVIDVTDTSIYHRMMQEALRAEEEMSVRDGLTGLYNRRYLETALESEFARAQRHGDPLSLIMLDVDHFKQVNDRYGHQGGDMVLKHVAAALTSMLRRSDTVGRYGGEEFTMILPQTDLSGAARLGERARQLIENTRVKRGDEVIQVTVSAGVTSMRQETPGHEGFLDEADQALYEAKRLGRNRVAVFSTLLSGGPSAR